MNRYPRWLTPVFLVTIITFVTFFVSKYAQEESFFLKGDISISPDLVPVAQNIRDLFIVVYD